MGAAVNWRDLFAAPPEKPRAPAYEYLIKRYELAEAERDYLRGTVGRQHETIERLVASAQAMSAEVIRLAQLRNPAAADGDIEDPPTRDEADRRAAIALRERDIRPVPGIERRGDGD